MRLSHRPIISCRRYSAFTLATCCHTCCHTSRSTCCSPCISMEPFTLATCCHTSCRRIFERTSVPFARGRRCTQTCRRTCRQCESTIRHSLNQSLLTFLRRFNNVSRRVAISPPAPGTAVGRGHTVQPPSEWNRRTDGRTDRGIV